MTDIKNYSLCLSPYAYVMLYVHVDVSVQLVREQIKAKYLCFIIILQSTRI